MGTAMWSEPGPWVLLAGGGLLGWLLLWRVRVLDHRTWVQARAPRLPIRALAVGDDAWLAGRVDAGVPLQCPWFHTACVAFSYQRQREHVTVTRDKDGKTRTSRSWRTERNEAETIDFVLDDGARIVIRTDGCTNEAMVGLQTVYERSDLRHVASVLEVGAAVSVLGVKQDDGSFAAQREVPLLLTRKAPDERVRSAHRGEQIAFVCAWLLPALCGVGAALWFRQPVRLAVADVGWALLAAVLMALPFWAVGTWNRLIRLRQQVQASFRQVDVDLAVRAALVPNLVAVVQAAAAHEQSLLRDLTAIRSGRQPGATVAAEGAAAAVCRQVLVLHERYPELRTDALYRDLHERLWACEEKLAHTRSFYNDIVREWNDRLGQLPGGLLARLMGCKAAPFFAADDAELPPRLANEM
ncbi:MAG: LemA family protein [Planctomycetes bacterium]|nr:LemA family protein [Planctomycetota bacterium]